MTEHYSHGGVRLLHGDCLDELRTLPDASVHAVVTDPPYGLEFMGKDWDSFGRGNAASSATAGMTSMGYTDGGNRLPQPTFLGGLNPRCTTCGKSQRGGSPCRCEAPTFTDERGPRLRAFQLWTEQWAAECLRVLKPGGHLLAFGGSRTWHRLAGGIEDAGFEVRDSIAWLYGSGFPKSLDVAKAIASGSGRPEDIRRMQMGEGYTPSGRGRVNYDNGGASKMNGATHPTELPEEALQWQGWGTALKPSFEPIVVARKPLAGTVAANLLAHGTGALNIDASRVGDGSDSQGTRPSTEASASRSYAASGAVNLAATPGPRGGGENGRWPSNVLLDVDQAAALDAASGVLTSGKMLAGQARKPKVGGVLGDFDHEPARSDTYGDSGGASRFFPVFRWQAKAPTSERPDVGGVQHPTVKPLALMQWLVRLVTPPGGTVLEPFAGSGTTLEACIREGFNVIGIEREADYLPLIMSRIRKDHAQSLFDLGESA